MRREVRWLSFTALPRRAWKISALSMDGGHICVRVYLCVTCCRAGASPGATEPDGADSPESDRYAPKTPRVGRLQQRSRKVVEGLLYPMVLGDMILAETRCLAIHGTWRRSANPAVRASLSLVGRLFCRLRLLPAYLLTMTGTPAIGPAMEGRRDDLLVRPASAVAPLTTGMHPNSPSIEPR